MKIISKNALIQAAQMQALINHTPYGIRDEGLLDSALNRAMNCLLYQSNCSVCDVAAEYAYGIIKNHPFIDGNKRMAYIACRLCLLLNGQDINAETVEKYHTIMKLADSSLSRDDFAYWLKQHAHRRN